MKLGAHMSIAGGLYKACERGGELGCNAIQIFTKNERQWNAKEITDEDANLFKAAMKNHGIATAFAHDTYLINLATVKSDLWKKSLEAFWEEILRCERLGLAFLVTHPGSPGEAGEAVGIAAMIEAMSEIAARAEKLTVKVLLETTAGQGSTLGYRFEQLARMIGGIDARRRNRFGVCFDTCHVYAAGYDIANEAGYRATMEEFDKAIGLDKLMAFHVNDSKKGLGCRVDRHENIGKGAIGIEAFRLLMNDARFAETPMVLETPKEDDMDKVNLKILRGLRKKS